MDRRFLAVFSHLKTTRLKHLRRPKPCSMRARSVEGFVEEGRPVLLVSLVGDHSRDATCTGRSAVGLAGIALVAARYDGGPDVDQSLETGRVQVEAMMFPE
jgi:hypothetical protein